MPVRVVDVLLHDVGVSRPLPVGEHVDLSSRRVTGGARRIDSWQAL